MNKEMLKPHNAAAYEKVKEMFAHENRACIVHATGTGKSWVVSTWLGDDTEKKTLFVAPRTEIIKQFETTLKRLGLYDELKENITFKTYAGLLADDKKNRGNGSYDQIVLDEFHRGGAENWGVALGKVLESNPDAKVLGTSATPIRFLDKENTINPETGEKITKSVDMAERLFENNIASTYELPQAFADGVITAPHYIIGNYTLEGETDELQQRIDKIKDGKERELAQSKLNSILSNINGIKGLPELFERKMNPQGKYIIFCKDKKHLKKVEKEMHKWFFYVNGKVETFKVYCGKTDRVNQRNIEQFQNSTSDRLKIMLAIDKLNEGVHVKDIDGVIMLRPTQSPIIHRQQLGRALAVDSDKRTVIFDLANNIQGCVENLKFIEEINTEVDRSCEESSKKGKPNNPKNKIEISAEVKGRLLHQSELYESLRESFAPMRQEDWLEVVLKELDTNQRIESGTLASACLRQLRAAYKKGKLSKDVASVLESRVSLDPHQENWDTMKVIFDDFCDNIGLDNIRLDTVHMGENIGQWFHNQRASVNRMLEGKGRNGQRMGESTRKTIQERKEKFEERGVVFEDRRLSIAKEGRKAMLEELKEKINNEGMFLDKDERSIDQRLRNFAFRDRYDISDEEMYEFIALESLSEKLPDKDKKRLAIFVDRLKLKLLEKKGMKVNRPDAHEIRNNAQFNRLCDEIDKNGGRLPRKKDSSLSSYAWITDKIRSHGQGKLKPHEIETFTMLAEVLAENGNEGKLGVFIGGANPQIKTSEDLTREV